MKAHILYTSSILGILDEVIHFFTDRGDKVNLLLPGQKTEIEKGDFLLLLDTGGINANTAAFFPTFDVLPPDVPPQDQGFEFFRQNIFSYYKDTQRAKIIAIGYASLAVYGELGGKVDFDEDGRLVPIPSKVSNVDIQVVGERTDFWWSKQIWGTPKFKFNGVFYEQICSFIDKKQTTPKPPPEAPAAMLV